MPKVTENQLYDFLDDFNDILDLYYDEKETIHKLAIEFQILFMNNQINVNFFLEEGQNEEGEDILLFKGNSLQDVLILESIMLLSEEPDELNLNAIIPN